MFSKVLVATDLSPASDKVVDYIKSLKPLGCREVALAYVVYVKHTVGLSEVIREEAQPKIEEQRQSLESAGLAVSVEMPVGVPGPEIISLAHQQGCSLIAVGSHGRSLAIDAALGGVATDVIHRSDLPALVVRLQLVEEAGEVYCRLPPDEILAHVLYATDFSDNAERAFEYVEQLAKSGCKKATLLHVQDVSRISPHLEARTEEFNKIDKARLDRLKVRLGELGMIDVNVKIPYGHPTKQILDSIRTDCPSIVVMGSHGRGFIADLFLGSVSHNVVRHSPVPVLLIPPLKP